MATTIAAPAGPNWLTPGPTQVFAAGYVFTLEAIGHLCVMAYGLSEETVRQLGHSALPIGRLAFVGPGMKPPKLPLDEETERFVDVWYPPSIRELEQFSDVHYRKMCHAAHHEGLSNSAAMCAKRIDEEGNPAR
ncbi:uncharacterized protein BXZ73DRAFT_79883 [Epithele typhae]|uniref:uncharacterized protein n=1 Tax=Epithele typhae TaxID=378194 RepID=UPI0020077C4E|nr:uncharacterized protein BXZ73DRAFT_79883 [Epithele typhae]KAH9921474.1 hypothetical protein BXZ73DRAFT_79883 [Epithele typhae]